MPAFWEAEGIKMAKEKIIQSANFKRDYITTMAVGIFILMVACELFVAIGTPIAISHSTLYAEHGTRQKMVSSFDSLRSQCNQKTKVQNPVAVMEKGLIRWDLDLLSSHLREYNRSMPVEDVENVIQDIQQYNTILLRLNKNEPVPYCQAQTLKLDKIVNRIENQLNSRKEL